jgi:hypothetical protein
MYDIKVQYLTNIINVFDNHGYEELTQYDQYHIILTIIEIMTYSFNCYLGPFIRRLEMTENIHKQFPILGMDDKGEYVIPTLYDMSMCTIQRNRLYSDNLHYNKLIIRSKEIYKISDNSNMVFQYFMSIYYGHPEFIISFLIEKYKIHRLHDYLEDISDNSESESDSEGEIDYPDEPSYTSEFSDDDY